MSTSPLSLVWLRRDLRLHDHAALHYALREEGAVQPVFVFDTEVLARFTDPQDRRLSFIAARLALMEERLRARGGGLLVLHGKASEVMPKLARALEARRIFAAEDYEPETRARDAVVEKYAPLSLVKDQLILSPREVLKEDGTPFKVFTPYLRAWSAALTPAAFAAYEVHDKGCYADAEALRGAAALAGLRVLPVERGAEAMLEAIGYRQVPLDEWPVEGAPQLLDDFAQARMPAYDAARDFPARHGTSRLSPYLRFGCISIREAFRAAQARNSGAATWRKELVWREFYAMILYHTPESARVEWNPVYRGTLEWSRNRAHFDAWRAGRTGYPLVDAAMRELLRTGWMHNRARMVVASFLSKHLRLPWQWGEEHFAQHLMDYELASNVGGWQWAASTGTDAQPYFRVFNPVLQSKKFDPGGDYIRRFVPELAEVRGALIHEPWKKMLPKGYPEPIVKHEEARKAALAMFERARA